jgi:hypothetical protein
VAAKILTLDSIELSSSCSQSLAFTGYRDMKSPLRSLVPGQCCMTRWYGERFIAHCARRPVIVLSDCKALEWLKTARDPTGRLARWAMKLSPYHLVIQHRPGTSNPNGDFMSRYPLNTSDSEQLELNSIESSVNILAATNLLDNIQLEQQKDPHLQKIIQSINSSTNTT